GPRGPGLPNAVRPDVPKARPARSEAYRAGGSAHSAGGAAYGHEVAAILPRSGPTGPRGPGLPNAVRLDAPKARPAPPSRREAARRAREGPACRTQ
ncbi:MAG TPA: hypothetical protein VL263_11760, partial [Vicinamibacterales bacterium]|nr:hypothetical protein [Vicinamibacterales bacterium]